MSLPYELRYNLKGLNLSRGKGRISNGKYKPRPWYEVEISSDDVTRSNPVYPKTPNTAPTIKHQKNNKSM